MGAASGLLNAAMRSRKELPLGADSVWLDAGGGGRSRTEAVDSPDMNFDSFGGDATTGCGAAIS